ncbi:MAG: type II toxin-antitoxin system Phd/YefM family antitoxin [Candidatus Binatia bacterium]
MIRTVSVSELKTKCLKLVDDVARQRGELIITKRGKRIARIVPLAARVEDEALKRLRGTLLKGTTLASFETGVRWEATRR